MGSISDREVMEECALVLKELGVPYEIGVFSAHRTPERSAKLAKGAAERGIEVFVAGAGAAAHLAGALASKTHLPVIGVPIASTPLMGMDALLATVQMPPGTHNAQPFRDGILFNDSEADALRYTGRGEGVEDRAMKVPSYDSAKLERMDAADDKVARPNFARGLCVLSDRVVAGGSVVNSVASTANISRNADQLPSCANATRENGTVDRQLCRRA